MNALFMLFRVQFKDAFQAASNAAQYEEVDQNGCNTCDIL